MSRPVFDHTVFSDVATVKNSTHAMRRRPVAGVWQVPREEDDPNQAMIESLWPADSPIEPPPPLINGWRHGGAGFDGFKYRWTVQGGLQLGGYLDPSEAESGTVCLVLPESYRVVTASFLTDIIYGEGFTIARVFIDAETGEITIQYPAEGILI